MNNLNSPDWALANAALRSRRDEMDAFKRHEAEKVRAAPKAVENTARSIASLKGERSPAPFISLDATEH